ncbi:MAG: hypothetical protein PHS14_03900 [Elusimicrobia bacterium]|nr:hypothetical protein [Elusimicrobiota bacterium]
MKKIGLRLTLLSLMALAFPPEGYAVERTAIIFSAAKASKSGAPNEFPFWTPTRRQIALLESLLPSYLKSNPPESDTPVSKPLEYGRQYVGVTKDGRKLIFLNAFCTSYTSRRSKKHLQERLVMADDGGSCFFQVYFDPQIQQFLNLEYNGLS